MKKVFSMLGIAAFTAIFLNVGGGLLATPLYADSTVVVTENDMADSFADVLSDPSKWFFYNDETDSIDPTLGSMVMGPETAPLGVGSAQISVMGTQRRNLATYQFSGTSLASITEFKYSTYNPSAGNGGSVTRSGYMNFNVDFNGSDLWQRRLVFLPTDNGTVVQDEWQEWDMLNGGNAMWRYSGSTWPGTATPGSTPRSWSDLLASYPGVRVRVSDSWMGIRVGEPYADGYTENIDKFVFGTSSGVTTFDFDPFVRTAEITSPVSGSTVSGVVNFTAVLHDDDVDSVQWAVRKGTCAMGTSTVWGNVDGKTDVAAVDSSDVANQTFSFTGDMSAMDPGMYCFIYNPVEDSGEVNIRLTSEFMVEEPIVVPEYPTSKEMCKSGGWKTFSAVLFRNQGDCVSWVVSSEMAVGNRKDN